MTTYTDYKLDSTGDRVIENGQFAVIYDEDVLKQQMEVNLKLSKRDWFLNLDEGVEYFNTDTNETGLFGARTITPYQEGQLQAAAENSLGVVAINTLEFDLGQDELIVYIEALTEFGNITVETTI